MIERIKEPLHTGEHKAVYLSGKKESPTLIIVGDTQVKSIQYFPLLLLLKYKGYGICYTKPAVDESPDECINLLPKLYKYLRYGKGIEKELIGIIGFGESAVYVSHAILPDLKKVFVNPKIQSESMLIRGVNSCVIHLPDQQESVRAYRLLNEPKQRVELSKSLMGYSYLPAIMEWIVPIPQEVIDLPEIKKEEKKED